MSALMSLLHNVNCVKKSDMVSPARFNPFAQKKAKRIMISDPRIIAQWLGAKGA